MDENYSRESAHNPQADQAGLENSFSPQHQDSCSDGFDALREGDDFVSVATSWEKIPS